MNLTKAEIEAILDEVQVTLNKTVEAEKNRAARLAKAEGDDDDSGAPEGSAPPEASGPPAEASAPPADAPPPEASAPPADAAPPGGDPAAAQGPVDPAALQAEYAKLPLDELKMHAEAAMAALQAQMGAGGDAGMGDPSMGAPPPGPEASAPPMAPAAKKEMAPSGNGGEMMKKSEISDLKAELDANREALTKITAAFTNFVSKPMRKAETALRPQVRPDPAPLSKSEAEQKLRSKIKDQSLTKSERGLINDFYYGKIKIDDPAIAHLLK